MTKLFSTSIKAVNVLGFLVCVLLFSCINSNSLKQNKAEETIKHFLDKNAIKTSQGTIGSSEVSNIEETNIFSQFDTSVKVNFKAKNFNLLFIFTRTPKNKWYLESIESRGNAPELTEWLKTKKNLHIPVG